ncbi:MAG: hypothetical protein U0787_17880 [Polyangia bacterium]
MMRSRVSAGTACAQSFPPRCSASDTLTGLYGADTARAYALSDALPQLPTQLAAGADRRNASAQTATAIASSAAGVTVKAAALADELSLLIDQLGWRLTMCSANRGKRSFRWNARRALPRRGSEPTKHCAKLRWSLDIIRWTGTRSIAGLSAKATPTSLSSSDKAKSPGTRA